MAAAFGAPCDLAVKSRYQLRHAVAMTNSLFLASVGPWICFAALLGLEANRLLMNGQNTRNLRHVAFRAT